MSLKRVSRVMLLALILTSAAMVVSADEGSSVDDDIDRTDFTEDHLKSDVASGPHSEIEPAWILPDCPDGKVPIGGTSDMLVALANTGSKMFNITHIEGKLLNAEGKQVIKLGRYDYGQSVGPREQRSFRYPMTLSEEAPLGEYTLIARAYYTSREKDPFVSVVYNETTTLVPPLPSPAAQLRMLQMALGGVGALVIALLVLRSRTPSGSPSKASKKAATTEGKAAATGGNEWLSGTLAGSEHRSPKKGKKKA